MLSRLHTWVRSWMQIWLQAAALALLVSCPVQAATVASNEDFLIVAIDDKAETTPAPGSTPSARYGALGYASSTRAEATAAALAQALGLQEQSAWRIAPLQWRCMLYRLAPGANREAVWAQLAADSRVHLVQPLHEFKTLATAPPAKPPTHYDDPYVGLQRGFIAIQAAAAQRWSQGDGVRVALIDSGVDADHPDLAGRVHRQRDVVGAEHAAAPGGERHGTEMAGVIAAVANNQLGIVGVAPLAQLWAYRACWPVTHGGSSGGSSCNSFTLAKALGGAIADGADVINLSLAGPADPLLQRLVEYATGRGAIVVGAMAAGVEPGFPGDVPGVLSVTSSDDTMLNNAGPRLALRAPGRDILTLAPGGGYGYASGASLAAAHVSGAVAVLRTLQPGLNAQTAHLWLTGGKPSATHTTINLCEAVRRLRPAADCSQSIATTP
jgi:subtilisin family serine protease